MSEHKVQNFETRDLVYLFYCLTVPKELKSGFKVQKGYVQSVAR